MAKSASQARAPSPSRPDRDGNYILSALPNAELQRIRPLLTRVHLEQKHPIWEPDRPIEMVYFPIDMVASVLAVTEDGGAVEVGTIGSEGFVGLPLFLGSESTPGRALIQIAGEGESMDAESFLREASRDGALRSLLHRYTQGFMTQVSQGTACNRLHNTEQRLARWLLIMRDRVKRSEFPLTHEFMGQMLGVRRATVTETAGALQRAGLISYRRGVIRILDPAKLERTACECYRIVRDEFQRLLGVPRG